MIESSIFPINNLHEVKCKYRLYKVHGLLPSSDEYEINKERLIKNLSFSSRSPCAIYYLNNEIYVAQADGFGKLPSEVIDLVRCHVKLEEKPEIYELNFDNLSDRETSLAIRFLAFSISDHLFSNVSLWQPHPGKTFYFKSPDREFSNRSAGALLYRGFTYGIAVLPNNKLAIGLDMTGKYLSRDYLPSKISEAKFQEIKGHNCVYEFGDQWYEITLEGLEGLPANEFPLQNGKKIYDYANEKIGHVLSANGFKLEKDCAVISHLTPLSQRKYVLSSLCRMTLDTDDPYISRLHYETQLNPEERSREIDRIIDSYFSQLVFNGISIKIGECLKGINRFDLPDLKFGKNIVLTTKDIPNVFHCSLNEFPKNKLQLLCSVNAGFYVKKDHLDKQYFVIPKSIANTCGTIFLKDLQEKFLDLYGKSTNIKYDPQIVTYDDESARGIWSIGNEIVKSVESDFFRYSGFALVMIPRLRNKSKEDQLASLVHKQLRKRDIYPAIIHDETVRTSYEKGRAEDGGIFWRRTKNPFALRKLRGYLHNVVLNKILLLNSCWPFILENGLEADMIIGIDVKNNTAGFTFFYGDQTEPRSFSSVTKESEKLSKNHVKSKILDFIRKEQRVLSKDIKKIVIHRDGRLFASEEEGILEALDEAANEGLISKDYDCNFLEIRETSSFPIRFFDVIHDISGIRRITNPIVGSYLILGNDGYIATTGRPYKIKGTARPIHIVKKSGKMPFEKLLKDFFDLTNLTWTQIEGCLRSPMTIKLTDLVLREEAGEYEEDQLSFVRTEAEND